MKYFRPFTLFFLFGIMLFGCSGGHSGDVLVDVNGEKITDVDLEFIGNMNPRIQSQLRTPAGRKQILDNLVEQELLYREAKAQGVNRNPDVKKQIELYRKVIIAQGLIEREVEAAAKKHYDEHSEEFKKLEFSHIMIRYATPDEMKAKKGKKETLRTEEEALKLAQAAKSRLEAGEEFAKVAEEMSEDQITKRRGGSFGAVSRSERRLISRGWGELLEKAFELPVGEVAGPLKTSKGYHVIVVTRGIEVEPFAAVKDQLGFRMRNDAKTGLVARLRKEAKIEYAQESPEQPNSPDQDEAGHDHPHQSGEAPQSQH